MIIFNLILFMKVRVMVLRPTETQLNAKGFTCISIKLSSIGWTIFVNDGIGQTTYQGLEFFVNPSGYAGIMKGDGTGSSSSDRSSGMRIHHLKMMFGITLHGCYPTQLTQIGNLCQRNTHRNYYIRYRWECGL